LRFHIAGAGDRLEQSSRLCEIAAQECGLAGVEIGMRGRREKTIGATITTKIMRTT
jgi:hypothetical protein